MDPAVRKLIDQPWPHRKRYEEIGALLPVDDGELDRWFAELVEAMDEKGFTMLCVAAMGADRAIDARHLTRGAALVGDALMLGSIVWHMRGNVTPPLLAATSDGRVFPGFQCLAFFALAAICQERGGGVFPPELITRARLLSRDRSKLHEIAIPALLGIAAITRDPGLATILQINSPERWASAAKAAESLKASIRQSPLERAGAVPDRRIGHGVTVRRAVERVGRNERCPCGSGRKYKNCCMARDAERLNDSSYVAGVSQAELRADPEPHLTLERLKASRPHEFLRYDPRKIPPALLESFFFGLGVHSLHDRSVECFELLGFPEHLDVTAKSFLYYAMEVGRGDAIRKFLALHPRAEMLQEDASLGIRLAMVEDNPARYLELVQEEALEAVRSNNETELHLVTLSLLTSKLSAVGILVGRGVIPAVKDEFAQDEFDQVMIARDKLGLSPDDPAGDLLEKRLIEKTRAAAAEDSKESRALAETRERLDAKAREVAFLRKSLETLRHDVKRREARPREDSAARVAAVPAAAPDQDALKELRFKVQKLKGELKERHEERLALREELREAHGKIETGAGEVAGEGEEPIAADARRSGRGDGDGRAGADAQAEADHLLPEERVEIQPIRLPEFPRKFHETLQGLPRHVARNAVATIGRLASGELAAFAGVLRLKACPETYRQRIGANHRLLFRMTPERLVVVDLINRRDLDRRIKGLVAGG